MADDMLKMLVKLLFGTFLWASFICYSQEFMCIPKEHSMTGFIFLYVFIMIFTIVGLVTLLFDNFVFVVVWCVCYGVVLITNAVYFYVVYAIVMAALTLIFGVGYAIVLFRGGGK